MFIQSTRHASQPLCTLAPVFIRTSRMQGLREKVARPRTCRVAKQQLSNHMEPCACTHSPTNMHKKHYRLRCAHEQTRARTNTHKKRPQVFLHPSSGLASLHHYTCFFIQTEDRPEIGRCTCKNKPVQELRNHIQPCMCFVQTHISNVW